MACLFVAAAPALAQIEVDDTGKVTTHEGLIIYDGVKAYSPAYTSWPAVWASGTVAGDFEGYVYAYQFVTASDGRYKRNVQALDGRAALDGLMRLRPVRYTFEPPEAPGDRSAAAIKPWETIGLIAQEVEGVFPRLVSEKATPTEAGGSSEAMKGIDYTALVPVLIRAVQEQQAEIGTLRSALEKAGIEVE